MEKCTCPSCNKLFFFDFGQVQYRATDDDVCRVTRYQKIVTCPYCGAAFLFDQPYEE